MTIDKNFHVSANYDFSVDYTYDSNNSGCTCDGYCRCSTVTNQRVNKVNYSLGIIKVQILTSEKTCRHYEMSTTELYCLDRLLRTHKLYDTTNYSVTVVNGYYGEEIGGVSFDATKEASMFSDIKEMLSMPTDLDKVKFVLSKEYAYILPIIDTCNNLSIVNIDMNNMLLNTDYMMRLKNDMVNTEYNFVKGLPRGVVYVNDNGTTRLIDGYNRLVSKNIDTNSYIVLSRNEEN